MPHDVPQREGLTVRSEEGGVTLRTGSAGTAPAEGVAPLAMSEEALRSLVDGSPIPHFVIDREHRVIHWNKALEAISGIPAAQVLGTRDHWRIAYDSPRPCLADLLLDTTLGSLDDWYDAGELRKSPLDGAYEGKLRFSRVGPQERWIHFTAALIRDASRRVIGAIETLEDVTEHVQDQRELRLKNLILSTQQETSIDGILVVDEQGKMISFNRKFLEMWGIPDEVAATRSDELAVTHVLPRLADPDAFLQKMHYLYTHRDEVVRDEVRWADGTVFDRYSAPMLGPAGEHYGRVWYFRDVTDRKKAEQALRESQERYRELVENLNEVIYAMGADGLFTFVTPAVQAVLGYSADELIGTHFTRLVHPDDRARALEALATVVSGGLHVGEYRCLHRSGALRWVRTSLRPCQHAGKIDGAQGVLMDLTERQALEEQARQAQAATQERLKELNCLYGVAEAEEACQENLSKLLRSVAGILPEAMLHPQQASARVIFQEQEFRSAHYLPPVSSLATRIAMSGEEAGIVEVGYAAPLPEADDGPFLKEERALVAAVAARLGRAAERIFARRQAQLQHQAVEQKNIAMREIMARIQDEQGQMGRQVLANVERVITPILDSLAGTATPRQQRYVTMLRDAMREVTSPFVGKLSEKFAALTPTELRLCALIKQGYTGKEIAELEHISVDTVRTHRFQIRRKLGLLNKSVNLASYLQGMQ